MAQPVRGSRSTAKAEFVLEDQAGHLLRRVYQRATAIFQEVVDDGVTPPQFAALVKIRDFGVVSQNRLGRAVAMDPATCQGVIQRLSARKLIARKADPEDRRRALLSLTPGGVALVARLLPAGFEVSRQLLEPLSGDEKKTFLKLLRRLT